MDREQYQDVEGVLYHGLRTVPRCGGRTVPWKENSIPGCGGRTVTWIENSTRVRRENCTMDREQYQGVEGELYHG
jgi:hypothetical protein